MNPKPLLLPEPSMGRLMEATGPACVMGSVRQADGVEVGGRQAR